MGLLLVSELNSYMEVKIGNEMYIDVNRGGEKLVINIDIELVRLPCSILSVDVQDVMGSHSVNLHGSLVKSRLDAKGNVISEEEYKRAKEDHSHDHEGHDHSQDIMPDYEFVKNQYANKEGCKIKGFFMVNKVPGNFHISSHAYGPILQRLFSEGVFNYDVAHKVNHMSFGSDKDLKTIKNTFNSGVLNPLDGTEKLEQRRKMYEYYLKIVPTTYIDISGNEFFVNQFTSNSNEVDATNSLPAVYFRFDMSPVTVKYWQYKENLLHFLIQICAILGGIFSVTGIIDALIHKSVVAILRKAAMGKLT